MNNIEKIAAKAVSEACKKKEYQYIIFQHPEIFDSFIQGFHSENEEAKKYIAKSIAYLSLKNGIFKKK